MNNLKFTLKSWPVIAAATIGLCYLTQTVAKWFGIELPDQANIEIVKRYAGWNRTFILLCAQVIILMPAIEELIFRYCLFRLPIKVGRAVPARRNQTTAKITLLNDCGPLGQRALPLGCGGRRGALTLPATREDLQLHQAIEGREAIFHSPLLSFTSFRSLRSLHNRNSLRVVRLRRT